MVDWDKTAGNISHEISIILPELSLENLVRVKVLTVVCTVWDWVGWPQFSI